MNDEQNGELDTSNQVEDAGDLDTSDSTEDVDVDTLREELEKARAIAEKNKTLAENYKIRAEKAERQNKMPKDTNQQAKEPAINSLSREEALLIAKGYDEEALEQLGKIAKITEANLLDAVKDPLFIAWQTKREADQKAEQARLGASKGSAVSSGKVSFTTPNISAEEHKRLWKEAMSK